VSILLVILVVELGLQNVAGEGRHVGSHRLWDRELILQDLHLVGEDRLDGCLSVPRHILAPSGGPELASSRR
jgi:hypothetical protein